jgi:hypothetical protein
LCTGKPIAKALEVVKEGDIDVRAVRERVGSVRSVLETSVTPRNTMDVRMEKVMHGQEGWRCSDGKGQAERQARAKLVLGSTCWICGLQEKRGRRAAAGNSEPWPSE